LHDGNNPPVDCASAGVGSSAPASTGSVAKEDSSTRRVTPKGWIGFIFSFRPTDDAADDAFRARAPRSAPSLILAVIPGRPMMDARGRPVVSAGYSPA